ncbi:MAG: pyridoxamine 5'-phosphate oxidase family protein [Burkholderiales bacterium]|nr:pyridoxamine 5'-phosphate oxidase family protein [Burkholderiales bacterium]MDE2397871.1 pyridoxamine 5'-phosphate oxidase family protein [Burkholderiales bacterium]MDE2454315.1 pyridoxamine 5'-phosphate oxidase family protein [Burkholderiales bacterium]
MVDSRLHDLAAIEAAVWRELAAAPQPGHAWRQGVLATTDGRAADARTVVLREVDPEARSLLSFTDARSPKVRQVETHPQGMLVLWSEPLGWQLRLAVRLGVETAGLLVSSRWARLKMTPAAHDYLSPMPPGSPIEHPTPERGTREHFAVLAMAVESIDWLELHALGHRRARFDAAGRRWLAP